MESELTPAEIGKRIAALRKRKGLSQEELAAMIRISRPSLAQIEQGNRGVDVLEMVRLSNVLAFSLDDFFAASFWAGDSVVLQVSEAKSPAVRVSVPRLAVEKFTNVLLYVLEKCAGKPNVGETVLNKLLYFCDFNYYEQYEEHLTGASYRKLPYGPVPQKLDGIMNRMVENGMLIRVKSEYHGYLQTRYMPRQKADLTALKASEKETIDRVIEQMADWSATMISDYSHKDMPWLATKDGEEIEYELAFYREAPFSARTYTDDDQG